MSAARLVAVLGLICCTVLACRGRPRQLKPPPECKRPETIECLSKYAFDELDESALRQLSVGLKECFARDARLREEQATCLPIELGRDRASGLPVVARYFCSDICPDQGGVFLTLKGKLGKAACCKLGGAPFIDPAFGGYRGCMPGPGHEALHKAACR